MNKMCKLCGKDYRIIPFIPRGETGKDKFEMNSWFFAYCKCDCGEFIIDRKEIEIWKAK